MNIRLTNRGEDGLASIIIVMTIIIVLALMTLGFTKLTDRELRQALDRELASQAYYAAESGLNDARLFIDDAVKNGSPIPSSSDCIDTSISPFFVPSISGSYNQPNDPNPSDNTVKYTCIILKTNPYDLIYDLKAGESKVFKMYVNPDESMNRIHFSWENKNYPADASGNINPGPLVVGNPPVGPLPQEGVAGQMDENSTGVLRATIYPIPEPFPSGPNTNSTLANLSRTFFMYPKFENTQDQIGSALYSTNGQLVDGRCNINSRVGTLPFTQGIGRYCNSMIDNVAGNSAAATKLYYIRLTALYKDLGVTIQAKHGTIPVQLQGAEAVVDVTGEGNDVLKRIHSRVPLQPYYNLTNEGLRSLETLCKRFRLPKIGPGTFDYGPAERDESVLSDPACLPN
ncbi:hypothetical protein H0X09_03380 [Candidatus Saccharibacteria bacterium]|nr:hypothetical protein [Candidatus Saccharibacteria bacterium]